ncbi:glutathione S-transferase family protein [Stappia indica]|uniref:glutathione S-transferase family protein n=1 Tax=Stappia indica TaxID=538381 RepID=UPI001CD509E7|nr:glutathione S-transferase family protein [Stappia indica]MCA1300380.1 glutathione S-transferase family protein [Stappia indica]
MSDTNSLDKLTLHYAPRSRASATRVLLDELGAPYDLHVLNMRAGEQKSPAFLAINPLGKVPALTHGDTILTEAVAIALYAGDLFPQAGLTPTIGDPRRGAYLRWMVFYAASFEPALMDKMSGHVPPANECAYGTFDQVIELLADQLERAPYLLGDRITIADIQWGATLQWALSFKAVPALPVFTDYAERITARPSFRRVFEDEARLDAEHEAAAAKASGGA